MIMMNWYLSWFQFHVLHCQDSDGDSDHLSDEEGAPEALREMVDSETIPVVSDDLVPDATAASGSNEADAFMEPVGENFESGEGQPVREKKDMTLVVFSCV